MRHRVAENPSFELNGALLSYTEIMLWIDNLVEGDRNKRLLKIEDLNPKRFVAKHMREEIAAIEEAKREISDTGRAAKAAATGVTTATAVRHDQPDAVTETPQPKPLAVPYDPEAT